MARRSVGILATALLIGASSVAGFSTRAGASGIVPPTNPTANVVLPQSLVNAKQAGCTSVPIDNSSACTQALLAEINYGLSTEGLAPITLPSNWATRTVPQQIFVIVDLERVARGLNPLLGLSGIWNLIAQIGAVDATDPPMPPGNLWIATEWAGGAGDVHSPLEADFAWMYDDGPGGVNIGCASVGDPGCWAHRTNILSMGSCTTCGAGAGYAVVAGVSSMAAVFVEPNGPVPALNFTWAAGVVPYLPGGVAPVVSPSPAAPPPPNGGYREVASDGGIFAFNAPFFGSMGGQPLNAPIVGMALDPWTGGYWEVASDGGIFAFNAPFYGSEGGRPLNAPIVGMALDPATNGYWEVAADGGIFGFNAPFHGSEGGQGLVAPIVGMAVDPGTGGYWEVASDGGIFAFDAPFFGSEGGSHLNAPIVGITRDPATNGYWEVAADGGIFAFNAPFFGSEGGQPLNAPIVGIAP